MGGCELPGGPGPSLDARTLEPAEKRPPGRCGCPPPRPRKGHAVCPESLAWQSAGSLGRRLPRGGPWRWRPGTTVPSAGHAVPAMAVVPTSSGCRQVANPSPFSGPPTVSSGPCRFGVGLPESWEVHVTGPHTAGAPAASLCPGSWRRPSDGRGLSRSPVGGTPPDPWRCFCGMQHPRSASPQTLSSSSPSWAVGPWPATPPLGRYPV